MATLPVEVLGWLANSLNLKDGDWVMTVGWERWLAAHAAIRGPVPLNVIWGCTDAVDATRDRLQLLASNVESGIRQLARLTRPKWDRGSPPNTTGIVPPPRKARGSVMGGGTLGTCACAPGVGILDHEGHGIPYMRSMRSPIPLPLLV